MLEPWQRWELHKARYAELWTSCEKSNFQQLSFLLRSKIPNTRLKISPCSHFPFIYFSSKDLFTLLQLSSAPVSWRKGPLHWCFHGNRDAADLQGQGENTRRFAGTELPSSLMLCHGTSVLPSTKEQSSPTSLLIMSAVPKMIKEGAAPPFDEEEEEWNVTQQRGRVRV